MHNLDSNEWANVIYGLIILSVLINGFVFRRTLAKSKILKYLAVWFAVIFTGVVGYSFKDDIKYGLARLVPYKPIKRGDNKLEIRKSSDDHFYIELKINEVSVLFLVDTGATDTVLTLKDAKKIGVDIQSLVFNKAYSTAGGTTYGASIKLDKVMVTDIEFKEVWVSVNKTKMKTSLLGMNFLERFKGYLIVDDRLILYY